MIEAKQIEASLSVSSNFFSQPIPSKILNQCFSNFSLVPIFYMPKGAYFSNRFIYFILHSNRFIEHWKLQYSPIPMKVVLDYSCYIISSIKYTWCVWKHYLSLKIDFIIHCQSTLLWTGRYSCSGVCTSTSLYVFILYLIMV